MSNFTICIFPLSHFTLLLASFVFALYSFTLHNSQSISQLPFITFHNSHAKQKNTPFGNFNFLDALASLEPTQVSQCRQGPRLSIRIVIWILPSDTDI